MEQFNILRFTEIRSTNSYALKHLDSLDDRQIIVAERQTRGYGRLGRPWISENPDNIYMSIVLKPDAATGIPTTMTGVTQFMSVTLCDLLYEYGVAASIKWPNDVRVEGAKIAGLLGEARFQGERFLGYVLGCGVNLNMTREDLAVVDQRATSLNLLVGGVVNREGFLNALLKTFFRGYDGFLLGGFPFIQKAYVEKCDFLGRLVVVKSIDREHHGIARAFTERGELVLALEDGGQLVLSSGDVEAMRYA
jgi:BirA family biotin operon repressor/biotin-[acetyl-CoA-carboxylase] ligase